MAMKIIWKVMNHVRKVMKYFKNSETNNEDLSKNTLEASTSSLPDISNDNDDEISELNHQIQQLKLELTSAHQEINNLALENNNLKDTITELTKKHELYKKATTILNSNASTPNKKIRRESTRQGTPKTPLRIKKTHQNRQVTPNFEAKEKEEQGETSTKSLKIGDRPKGKMQQNTVVAAKHKICIISSNKTNNILQTAQDTLNSNHDICHYLTPHAGIKDQLKGIHKKVEGYTKNDYCVIMIGETDFEITHDYLNLVFLIRDSLQKLQHTNIILCLPVFKFGKFTTMFRWRVESFNNLLYLDNLNYEYAYLLDSNLQLSYDYEMFSARRGTINNKGICTIFLQIKQTMTYIKGMNNQGIEYTESEGLRIISSAAPNARTGEFFREQDSESTSD